MERNWYVICTKQQQEKKVSTLLTKKGIENYCPYTTVEKKMGSNKIILSQPLFSTYVFALLADAELILVKKLPQIINTVYWKSKPVIIKQEEINALKLMAESFINIKIERATICINEKIGTLKEKLSELSNSIMGIQQQRIAVTIHSLGYTIVANKEHFKYSRLEEKKSFVDLITIKLSLFSFLGF